MKKKLGIGIICLFILLTAICIGGGFYMINYALRPTNENVDQQATMERMCKSYPQIRPWLDSLQQHHALCDTFITAPDGIRMHAYYAHASHSSRATSLIIHGYTDCAVRMFHIGYLYNQILDYNVIIPDLRYSGLTEGEAIQMGWLDRKDVMQWIDLAPTIFGDSIETVIHGISMGAATTMMTSGENLPAYIKCFVEDCGYTSVWDQFEKELKEQFGLPAFPLLHVSSYLCNLQLGWDFKEASAVKQVAKCKLPMFFIHGDSDNYVPTYMVHEVYEAKPEPKYLWVVPKTAHAASYQNYPQEYTERVRKFVNQYIKDKDDKLTNK